MSKNYTLSATQYKRLCVTNDNLHPVANLLDRNLERTDLGCEVGAGNYVDNSKYIFIKTKALQSESFLLCEENSAMQCISPKSFIDMQLKEGDILISKDANVGEIAILEKDFPNAMLCGGIYRLPIMKNKYYFLAFVKSNLFRQQIDFLVPRGSTLRHGKTIFLNCCVPFPKTNTDKVIKYVEILVKTIIKKENEIRQRHYTAMKIIRDELLSNSKDAKFQFALPRIKDILCVDRMDSRLFSKKFKEYEFNVKNYKYGFSTIHELGFKPSRGQNLQVSNIGESIYSSQYRPGYYTLILPKFISKYGTVTTSAFLGNPNSLKTLKKGEIIFGAEGNEKGRSLVVIEEQERTITNIHGLTLTQSSCDLSKGIFVKLFLDYYRSNGMIDAYAVGSNGGSLAIKYWDYLKFPNFPKKQEQELTKYYYSGNEWNPSECNMENFEIYDQGFNMTAGIYELDKSMKYIRNKLDNAIEKIINDENVEIVF